MTFTPKSRARSSRLLRWMLVCSLGFGTSAAIGNHAAADDALVDVAPEDAQAPAERRSGNRRRWDYSRFSDGPRRVPEPRGTSQVRAEALGLGSEEAASRALHQRPDARWLEAARAGGREVGEHLRWPVQLGRFGRGFGYVRRHRPNLRHNGVDIVAAEGSVVRAVADGLVIYSDNGIRGYGNCVVILHPDGVVSLYAHNYRTTVQPGWQVREGERIAFSGNTGISRGPHVHFELRRNGHPIDPLPRFEGRPWIDAYRRWQTIRENGEPEVSGDHLLARLPADRQQQPSRATTPQRPAAQPESSTPNSTGIGSIAFARRMLGQGPNEAQRELVEGRQYSNLLWPVRGGSSRHPESGGVNIAATENTPVRATADGLVVFAGEGLRGVGKAIVVMHRNGWVSLFGNLESLHVEVGQQIQRGEWIARVGGEHHPHLHFQLRESGRKRLLDDLFVQVPEAL